MADDDNCKNRIINTEVITPLVKSKHLFSTTRFIGLTPGIENLQNVLDTS